MSKINNYNTGSLSTVNQLQAKELIDRTRAIYEQGGNLPLSEQMQVDAPRVIKAKPAKKRASS